jgi:hypothetical protein
MYGRESRQRVMFDGPAAARGAQLYKREAFEQGQREEDAKRQEIIRQSAKGAVDPQTGEYDLNRHVQALEQNGFPEIAQEYRKRSIDSMGNAYRALDDVLKHTTTENWPQKRKQLLDAGIPAQMVPEQYDPEALRQQHKRLGMVGERYGAFGPQAKGPGGAVLYGQENLETGKLENVREVSPPGARGGGGGGGDYAPSQLQREADYVAEVYGIDRKIALDVVRNDKLGRGREGLIKMVTQTMLGQYASPEEAVAAATEVADRIYGPGASSPASMPGRPRANDVPRQPGAHQPRPEYGGRRTIPIQTRDGGVVQQPLLPERGQAGGPGVPPPEALQGLQPGYQRPFKDGSVWTVDEQGRPVRVR